MFKRNLIVALAAVAALAVLTVPATAQNEVVVAAQNPSFDWTGKVDQTVNYQWSTTIDNPSRKDLQLAVTLEFLDDTGTVVTTDRLTVEVAEDSSVDVDNAASITWAQAQEATQYRITLAEIEG